MDIIELIFRHHPELASAMMRGDGIGADLTKGELRRMFPTLRFRPQKETENIIKAFRQNPAALRSSLAQSAGYGSGATAARLALANPMLARGSAVARGGTGTGFGILALEAILDADRDLPGIQAVGRSSGRGRILGRDTLRQTPFSGPSRPEDMVRMSDIIYEGAEDPRTIAPAGASQTMTRLDTDDVFMGSDNGNVFLEDELDNFERMQGQVAEGRADAGTLVIPGSPRTERRRNDRVGPSSRLERDLVEQARGLLSPKATQKRQGERRQEIANFDNNRVRPAAPEMPRGIRPDEPEMGVDMQSVLEELLGMGHVGSMSAPRRDGGGSAEGSVPRPTTQGQSSAIRADRAKPRRRLQPTAPGIFGELLDESITDFQGAPMMSEREILRMIRGE